MLCFKSPNVDESPEEVSSHSNGRNFNVMFRDMAPVFPQFIGMVSIPNTPSDGMEDYQLLQHQQELTTADVEMIDSTSLQMFLEK